MRPAYKLVVPLDGADGDPHLVGGKAASLVNLIDKGYRVPPGFCLTTEAFETQRRGTPGIQSWIDRLPDEAARTGLAAAFERGPIERTVGVALDLAIRDLVDALGRTTSAAT